MRFDISARNRFILALSVLVALLALVGARVSHAESAAVQPCTSGMAGSYPCEGYDLASHIPLDQMGAPAGTLVANLWGWTDSTTNKEYVLLGLQDGTAFFDVTMPDMPVYLGRLPTQTTTSVYRDIKVYQNYAYIIADAPSVHGIQIFDLTQLRTVASPPATFTATAHYSGIGNGHNIFINEQTGHAFVARNSSPTICNGALTILDLATPLAPTMAGCFDLDGLASDSHCVVYAGPDATYTGHEICAIASDDSVIVADVNDPAATVQLSRTTYPNIARAHHLWFTEDHKYFISADMDDEHHHGLNTRLFIWNAQDLNNVTLQGIYTGPTTASDHNVWVKGNTLYAGELAGGFRSYDLSQISAGTLTETGYFDSVPASNAPGHTVGAWAVYPYFASGTIAFSDRTQGLYLVRPSVPTAVTLGTMETSGVARLPWVALSFLLVLGAGLTWRRRAR